MYDNTEGDRSMSIEVKLLAFEGPLELLLHLIEKNKLNIYDIPIVEITQQYLYYLDQMEETDLDTMSEFLVMAATLINIKAKMLLPKQEKEEEEEDPREELVRRLLEYKVYKYAASELKDKQIDAKKILFKGATIPNEVLAYQEVIDPAKLLEDITLQKLNQIFLDVMKRQVDKIDPIRSKFGRIEKEEISVEDKMIGIRAQIKGLKRIRFYTLLEIQASKTQLVVTFLAVLELMKMGLVRVLQDNIFDDIIIDSLE